MIAEFFALTLFSCPADLTKCEWFEMRLERTVIVDDQTICANLGDELVNKQKLYDEFKCNRHEGKRR